jgi:hypothetical protein
VTAAVMKNELHIKFTMRSPILNFSENEKSKKPTNEKSQF